MMGLNGSNECWCPTAQWDGGSSDNLLCVHEGQERLKSSKYRGMTRREDAQGPDLISTLHKSVLKHHTVSHQYVQLIFDNKNE